MFTPKLMANIAITKHALEWYWKSMNGNQNNVKDLIEVQAKNKCTICPYVPSEQ